MDQWINNPSSRLQIASNFNAVLSPRSSCRENRSSRNTFPMFASNNLLNPSRRVPNLLRAVHKHLSMKLDTSSSVVQIWSYSQFEVRTYSSSLQSFVQIFRIPIREQPNLLSQSLESGNSKLSAKTLELLWAGSYGSQRSPSNQELARPVHEKCHQGGRIPIE